MPSSQGSGALAAVGPLQVASETQQWAGLGNRFLLELRPSVRARVFSLAERMAKDLDLWAARYPQIRRVRIRPLSLSVAAAAPFSSVEALTSSARVSLWVFTLDDMFDEEHVPRSELMRRARSYLAIVRNATLPPAIDRLGVALRDVREDLGRYPLFAPLGPEWANALCGTIRGMVHEYRWRSSDRQSQRPKLPTYEDYVANGRFSIGGPPHIWSALITIGDPSTPRHLTYLRPMEELASTCVRLANDLRSYSKEIEEGKINSVVLLSRGVDKQGLLATGALREARARVLEDIARGLSRLREMRARPCTETGLPEAAIADIARFVCEFYMTHDYHTFQGPVRPEQPREATR